ncbi:MAG: sugar kinase [Mycetocola sp.]
MATSSWDVISVGETMVLVTPIEGKGLDEAGHARLDVGGAESNVVQYLAQDGHATLWGSALGRDALGDRVEREVREPGVETIVYRDPLFPTGVYFKDVKGAKTRVHYYRAGSAASRLGPGFLQNLPLDHTRVLHLTGITPALSTPCAELIDAAFARARAGSATISFDVNYRSALWPPDSAAPKLLELARRADIVFVGLDEASGLWSTQSPTDVRTLLPNGLLVVKNGAVGATAYFERHEIFVPTPAIEVVEEVGAGDAFAAGFLSAWLRGNSHDEALTTGHRFAGFALSTLADVARLGSAR